MYISDS